MNRRLVSALALSGAVCAGTRMVSAFFRDAEVVIFYPTYGVQQSSEWRVDVRAKVQEPSKAAAVADAASSLVTAGESREQKNLHTRLADFVADDEPGEKVVLAFDGDSTKTRYRIAAADGTFPSSNAHGLVEGTLTLSDTVAQRLLAEQGSKDGWLTYRAVSKDHTGVGRVRLIGPAGVSVISDIDDTIKVTQIPLGIGVVVKNTFFRDFDSTTELAAVYKELAGAPVHYVSGGPWQMYRPLATFVADGRHPEGSFHMKRLSGGLRTPKMSFEDLARFVSSDGTVEHKTAEISRIMQRFSRRTFVLIGDSGEKDPEVYRGVKARFGAQVERIVIRDLTNARELCPARLTGMEIVTSPTIAPCVPGS
jgi:phosphatidate phosphatase APP1